MRDKMTSNQYKPFEGAGDFIFILISSIWSDCHLVFSNYPGTGEKIAYSQ